MAGIRLVDLAMRFGTTTVLEGINLEIKDGEFMVLVGPSGCAKSTTLRLISGLEQPSAGEIWVGDEMVNGKEAKDRNLAMVFQSYALFPNMTVRGNLSFGMEVRQESAATIAAEVERIAAMLGLEQLLDRKPHALSGGQAQRVALGRAIIRQPAAFLFDEPLSNLDAELRTQMRGEIVALQRELKATTIYVTHDQTEAMTMGDRIAVMRAGDIMQVGTPMRLYADPANLFVANFLGSPKMNMFSGEQWPAAGRLGGGDKTTIGIRAEHIRLEPAANGAVGFEAVVRSQEKLGHEVLLWLEPQDGQGTAVVARSQDRAHHDLAPGAAVKACFEPRDALFFDAATDERVAPPAH